MTSIASRLPHRGIVAIRERTRRAGPPGLIGLCAAASAAALGTRGGLGSFALALAISLGAALATAFLLNRRYELSLAVLMVYLGVLDGFLKLKTGHSYLTLIRDLLLYAIAAGALVRLAVRGEVRPPPFTGWIVAYVAVVLVQVANPANTSLAHTLGGVRPHLEFVPLFFLGYAVLRSARRLRMFFYLLLALTAVNGAVALYQYQLSPDQLASWGPGYHSLIEGTEGVAGRTSYGDDDTRRVRPPALGSDTGFSGALAALAAPAAVALIILPRRRLARIVALGLGASVIMGLLGSQTRISILAAVFALLAFAAISTVSRRRVQLLIGTVAVAALAWLAVSVITQQVGGPLTERYQSISPSQVVHTSTEFKKGSFELLGQYAGDYPLGTGLGNVGPATDFGGNAGRGLDGENEFNFLLLELGYPGLLLGCAMLAGICAVSVRRVRRVTDPEIRVLLIALTAGLISAFAVFAGGPITSGTPYGAYIWLVAGALTWWLVAVPRMQARQTAPTPPVIA